MPTGEVSLRFSVTDAETVRTALEKLGKDGQTALDKLNAAGQTPSAGLNALSVAGDKLKSSILGLAYSIGPLGDVLLALGPAGTAVAASFGAVIAVFSSIKDRANDFKQYARDVKDAGESTGFTTTQIQALTDLLGKHGVTAEQAAAGLQRFATEQVSARQGSGQLYDELKRISPAMAEAFGSARTPAAALDVLSKAIASVDNQTGILLGRLAAGKGSAGFVASLQEMAGQGGLGAVEQAAVKVGLAIDDSIIQKQATAAVAAQQKAKQVEQNWNAAASNIMQSWKDFKKSLGFDDNWSLNLSIKLKEFTQDKSMGDLAIAAAETWVGAFATAAGKIFPSIAAALSLGKTAAGYAASYLPASQDNGKALLPGSANLKRSDYPEGEAEKANPEADRLARINDATRANALERERLGILGDTASTEEKIKAKTAEVTLALMERKNVTAAEAKLVTDSYANQARAAEIASRTSLGVASADERRANFEERLSILVREGVIGQQDQSTALMLYNKTLKETIENEQVRASLLPGLQRMQLDAANLNKTLDTFGTTVAGDVGNAFVAITSGTQSASDGFKNLEQAVLQSLSRMVYQMTIAKLVAQGLNSVLGFFGGGSSGSGGIDNSQVTTLDLSKSAFGNVFDRGNLMPFARGGIINRPSLFPMANGGTGLAGEAGPEAIMPLSRGRDGKLGVAGGGSQAPVVNVIIQNNSNEQASAGQAQQNSNGGFDIPVMIGQVVKDKIARGDFDAAMGARFGTRSGTVRR